MIRRRKPILSPLVIQKVRIFTLSFKELIRWSVGYDSSWSWSPQGGRSPLSIDHCNIWLFLYRIYIYIGSWALILQSNIRQKGDACACLNSLKLHLLKWLHINSIYVLLFCSQLFGAIRMTPTLTLKWPCVRAPTTLITVTLMTSTIRFYLYQETIVLHLFFTWHYAVTALFC